MLFPLIILDKMIKKVKKESQIAGDYCFRRKAGGDGLVGISIHTKLFLMAGCFGSSAALAGDRQEQSALMGEFCMGLGWLG